MLKVLENVPSIQWYVLSHVADRKHNCHNPTGCNQSNKWIIFPQDNHSTTSNDVNQCCTAAAFIL